MVGNDGRRGYKDAAKRERSKGCGFGFLQIQGECRQQQKAMGLKKIRNAQ